MVAKKTNSKRLTLRTKYKIKHKVKEHKKKLKKLHRKNPHLAHHKSKRDPGIPNHWPFKNELLEQIEKHRLEEEAKRKQQSELAKKRRKKELELKKKAGSLLNSTQTSSLLSSSTSNPDPSSSSVSLRDRQTLRSLHDLIDVSDLILLCLDARDPLGSRCPVIEKRIVSASKSMVFVLTHADCIPPSVLASWLRYLNCEAPTIAFNETPAVRALKPHVSSVAGAAVTPDQSTTKLNSQRKFNPLHSALSRRKLDKGALLRVDEIGPSALALIEFLQNFRPASDSNFHEKPLQVSVLGFGNVGKSTLINALCRLHAVTVSPNSGFTKSISKVKMSKQVSLFDTPAIPSIAIHPGPHITLPLDRAEQTGMHSYCLFLLNPLSS
jgi:nuclear GTP-binding protein